MKNRWINLLFLLVIVLISALAYRLFVVEQTREAARLLINILRPLSHLLIAIVLYVLLRSLVKLYFARRRQSPGYRLQTKVLLSLLPLTVLPSIALFLVSTRYLDDFFLEATATSDEREIIASADDFIDDYEQKVGRLLLRHAEPLAVSYRLGDREALVDYLTRFAIDGIEVYEDGDLVDRITSPELPGGVERRLVDLAGLVEEDQLTQLTDGLLVMRFVHNAEGFDLHILDVMESDYSERFYYIRDSARFLEYNQKKTRQLQGLNQSILLVTTFTILFGGIWTALALSNRFLEAFRVIVTGAEKVASGDLETRLSLETGDEMEEVLHSFNLMTRRLDENQRELERRALDLSTVNTELTSQIQYNQTILELTNAGILSTDNEDRIERYNPAAARILGLARIDIGARITEVLVPERHGSLLRRWAEHGRDPRKACYAQLELAEEEGGIRHVAVTIVALEDREQRFGTLLVLEDLTQLLNAQKLAAWREVAKRVAHEIKNPLTPIQLSIQRVQRKASRGASDLVEVVRSAHDTIMRETEMLANLVNEFSTFARLPSPVFEETDLAPLIDSVVTAYRPVFPGIDLRTAIAPDVPSCRCDPDQIRQVLTNLIQNAAAAMAEEPGTLSISLEGEEEWVVLVIADEGPGIPDEEKPKVFLPYYSKSPKGTGLGLAIVKRIIEDHGGTIAIGDHQPRGTRVEIRLPC